MATAGTINQSRSTVTFDSGDLAIGGMATSTLVVIPTAEGTIMNTASVSLDEPLLRTVHDTSTNSRPQATTTSP